MQGGSPGASTDINYAYTSNKRNGFTYDAAGNLTNDVGQTFSYDATGQQVTASFHSLQQSYDGDGLRIKKSEDGTATYFLRSTVLGGGVVAEINVNGAWQRGLVYAGGSLLAVQQSGVYWMHEDPVTKSKRVTNSTGAVVSSVELDPWGADTNRSSNSAFQPKKFTSYDRDNNGSDEAMFRRFNRWHSRFDQPDPYDGSYDITNPQTFNRYAYVNNDPVNFTDPTGLDDVPGVSPIDPATGNPFFIPAGAFGVIINIGGWEGSLGTIGVGVSDRDVMLDIDMANFAGITGPQKPKPNPQLTPEQKKEIWQQVYEECLNQKEAENQAAQRERERLESRQMTTACIVGGVVGALEGGLEFGPLGIPLGFHFGCMLGAGEHILPILALPDSRETDKKAMRRRAEGDCKRHADRVVSRL